jgi:hypothetical protein
MARIRTCAEALFTLALYGVLGCSSTPAPVTDGTPDNPANPPTSVAGTGALPPTPTGMNPAPGAAGMGATPVPDPGTTPTPDPGNMPDPGGDFSDPQTPLDSLPQRCKGFEVRGLQYSPGGTALPNTCAPFDSIYNNPFAVRCIDADPAYDSGYAGDEFCILAPEPALGTQLVVAPEDRANPPPEFVMQPEEEVTDYYYANTPNAEERFFYRVNIRMRAGSHHMINRMLDADRADGFSSAGGDNFTAGGSTGRSFPGSQRPNQDRPMGTFEVPPENAGLGDRLMVRQQFSLNLHHFNFTDQPALREVWINIWYKDAAEVTDEMGGIAIFGSPADVAVPPGERRTLHYRCDVPGNTRIITLNGHRHTWTERFGVWLERAGETIPVYESFYYDDMPTYQYDSISTNPTPDIATRKDGAFSGMLEVSSGDELHFVCDINNTSGQQLRFANEVMTGEMCILFGSRTGDALCGSGTRVQ